MDFMSMLCQSLNRRLRKSHANEGLGDLLTKPVAEEKAYPQHGEVVSGSHRA